jgi:hypothetical protein
LQYADEGTKRKDQAKKEEYTIAIKFIKKTSKCTWIYECNSYREKPNKMQQCIKILLSLVLNEARHVSGDTQPIIRSLKLPMQLLVLHNIVEGCWTCSCWTLSTTTSNNCNSDNLPRYYAKPEASYEVLGS